MMLLYQCRANTTPNWTETMEPQELFDMNWDNVTVSLSGEVKDEDGNDLDFEEMEAAVKAWQVETMARINKLRKMLAIANS